MAAWLSDMAVVLESGVKIVAQHVIAGAEGVQVSAEFHLYFNLP